MNRMALFAVIILFNSFGCNPPPSATTGPAHNDKKVDVHIRTPRGNVDVEKNKKGGTDVDVNRQDK